MNIGKFKELLHIYGSDPSRWPKAQLKSAKQFLKDHPEVRELHGEFDAIDRMFAKGRQEKAPNDLLDKIIKKIDTDKN
jgi:hypothetical protein